MAYPMPWGYTVLSDRFYSALRLAQGGWKQGVSSSIPPQKEKQTMSKKELSLVLVTFLFVIGSMTVAAEEGTVKATAAWQA
jgi:hypothetical protein